METVINISEAQKLEPGLRRHAGVEFDSPGCSDSPIGRPPDTQLLFITPYLYSNCKLVMMPRVHLENIFFWEKQQIEQQLRAKV